MIRAMEQNISYENIFAILCFRTLPYHAELCGGYNQVRESTLDLSEFNVNVMTGNNGTHLRSPYDPEIQK